MRENSQIATEAAHLSNANRRIADLNQQIAGIRFASGKVSSPESIILDDLFNYESLDQNWNSYKDSSGRVEAGCSVGGRAAVIVTLGQSNAANHGLARYTAQQDVRNFNLYDGKCYHASDPLLGASGAGGNFATRLGDILIKTGTFDTIVIAPIGMGGTIVEQWADEGMFNGRILAVIRRLHDAGLRPTYILWHQGEGNPGIGDVNGRQYRKNLLEVVRAFREYGIESPFFVALATRCGPAPHPNAENIRSGQRSAVGIALNVFLGPDTDNLGPEFRDAEMCHFNARGLEAHAKLWADVLLRHQQKTAQAMGFH